MKKLLLCIIIVFTFSVVKVHASGVIVSITPVKYNYEIPLDSPNLNAIDFKVEGRINNKVISKKDYQVQLGVGGYTLSNVNTREVGVYKLSVRVTFINNSLFEGNYVINVNVYDPNASLETIKDDYRFEVNSDDIMKRQFNNYENIKFLLPSNFSTSKIGVFDVKLKVKTYGNNWAEKSVKITIYDEISPVITQKSQLVVNLSETIDLAKYFDVTDNSKEYLIDKLELVKLDKSVIGRTNIELQVTDSSNNTATAIFEAVIIDDIAPTITFKNNPIVFPSFNEVTEENLKTFILENSDNIDVLTLDDVTVDYSLVKKQPGLYDVIYSIKDKSNNVNEYRKQVQVLSQASFVVTATNFSINKGEEVSIDKIIEHLKVSDNRILSRSNVEADLSEVDNNKVGDYNVSVKIKINNDFFTSKNIVITVKENTNNTNYLKYIPYALIGSIIIGYFTYTTIKIRRVKKENNK